MGMKSNVHSRPSSTIAVAQVNAPAVPFARAAALSLPVARVVDGDEDGEPERPAMP
jgi:hypothetical protein